MPKLLAGFIALCLIVFFVSWNQPDQFGPINKSPNDAREYKAIKLENDLVVFLISDPETDKAAASLDVNVGSSNDPTDFLGLAHFLEHMLFLGTKKYPEADEYQKYIRDHGGSHNAFTSAEHTNYFFDVNANHLEGALDRFAQQFTAPLFNEEYVEREVNAVHSEFTAKIKDDNRRYFSVLREILSKDHPYSKFSVGNLETLKDQSDITLREALLKFYDENYSANKMRLVLLGKQPISELEDLAEEKFSGIPNTQLESQTVTQPFFAPNFLPAQVNVQTIMDKRTMTVAFPVPSAFEYHRSQPISYISNLIGHEGEGSLLSYLKERELVDTLGAGTQFDTRHNAIMSISMSLTQAGLTNQKPILEAIFSYINLIKEKGIQKLYFDEQAKMKEIGFQFQEKSEPIHYVSAISNSLHDMAPETVLSVRYQLDQFDEALYKRYLDLLTPENMLISLSAKSMTGDKTSQWYDTSYELISLDKSFVKELSTPMIIPELALPVANQFIPDNVSFQIDKTETKPTKLLDKAGLTVWYAPDMEFGTPKANLFVTIRSPIANQSAKNRNLIELMVSLIKDDLNEFSYPAYLAGLNYDLYNHMRGMTIKIQGYSDKQQTLLTSLLKGIKEANFEDARFKIYKERLMRSLQNAKKKKPFEQAIANTQKEILSPSWTDEERLDALKSINIEDVKQFHKDLLKQLDIAILSTGNVTEASSKEIANKIEETLLNDAIRTAVPRAKVLDFDGEKNWVKTLFVDHPDTGFVYYLQGESKRFEERALFMVLSQMIASDYYTQLRTEKQLGYIVFATNFSLLEQPALAFVVQSPTTQGSELIDETTQFLDNYKDKIANLSSDDLSRYKNAVISRLEEKDSNLFERSNRYWQEIDQENFAFNTKNTLIETIEGITQAELGTFYNQLISSKGNGLAVFTTNDLSKEPSFEHLNKISEAQLKPFE